MPGKTSPIPSYHPKRRAEWRKWLAANHASSQGVWLVLIKKGAGMAGIMYSDAWKKLSVLAGLTTGQALWIKRDTGCTLRLASPGVSGQSSISSGSASSSRKGV